MGAKASPSFTALRDYAFTLIAADDTSVLASTSGVLICRYVRREIRQLTDADRVRFFDTMATLWNTRTEEGSERYGAAYVDIQTLSTVRPLGPSLGRRRRARRVVTVVRVARRAAPEDDVGQTLRRTLVLRSDASLSHRPRFRRPTAVP
jgi:hypothetical protein